MKVADLWNTLSCYGMEENVTILPTGIRIGPHGFVSVPPAREGTREPVEQPQRFDVV